LSVMTPTRAPLLVGQPPVRRLRGGAASRPPRPRGSVVDLRLVARDARRREVLVEQRLPHVTAVGEQLVDVVLQDGVALRDADAVALLAEGLTGDLELVGALRDVAGEDRL